MKTPTRFYKDRYYIGVRDHNTDSWGDWQDVVSARVFIGKPSSDYKDEVYEYTDSKWAELKKRIQYQARELNREFAERPGMMTTYPIWKNSIVS